MSAITSRPEPKPKPGGPEGPLRNALEGAASVVCAVVAMAAVSALALWMLDAGSVGSLWSLTAAVTAMAVGGSVSAGSDQAATSGGSGAGDLLGGLFGGGGMGPSMTGAADVVPLGVTLAGSLVLWLAFSRPMRGRRRYDTGELAVRAGGAGAAALIAFPVLASVARGTFSMPMSAMSGLRGEGTESGGFGGGQGGAGDLLGGLFGGGTASREPAMTYEVQAGSAAFGALLWVAVVLVVGCLISRRVPLPPGFAVGRLRPAWAPSVSAVVRTLLVVTAVPVVLVVFVGVAAGGRAATAAGAALLLAPNAVAVVLTLGLGSSWTASTQQVRSQGGNPLAGLMGGTAGQGTGTPADRTQHLGELSAGGWPLWAAALAVTGLVLVACAYKAARTTDPAHTRPPHRYRGPFAPHLGFAERFGVVTAVILGAAAWLAGASGNFGISMFGSELGGTRAELTGSTLWTVVCGLLAGAVAGFAGCLLRGAVTNRSRILARDKALKTPANAGGGRPAPQDAGPGADSGPLEAPVGNR